MSLLGFVHTQPATVSPGATPPSALQLRIADTLASAHRLWVRGQVVGLSAEPGPAPTRWWQRRRTTPLVPLATARLETQVSGKVVSAEVPLGPQGEIEACFTVDLPTARRGWRVARNQVSCAGQTGEACGLVLTPPADTVGIVVVLLPRAETLAEGGATLLERSQLAARVTPQLAQLRRERHEIYYVACVSPGADGQQAELALAATALGWPSGHFVLLPAAADEADDAVAHALDRLRWLFAGDPLLLINLDPEARRALATLAPAEDRADVRTFVLPPSPGWAAWGNGPVREPAGSQRPLRSARVTQYPLVFCHGMLACTLLRMQLPRDFNYFSVMRTFLQERGFRALYPLVTPTGGVVERAEQLREQITRWTDEPVNIIAHSMGGLDARHLITHLGMADRVKSLTTISTPHRGTPLADWFLTNYRNRVPLLLALEAIGVCVDGFRDCRPEVCRAFNERTPDRPEVRYFSYAGDVPLAKVTPMLRRAWDILTPLEGPNDGLVSVQSARWGEFLGTIASDHFAQTPDGLFIHPGEDFNSLGFICRLIDELGRRGF